MPNKRKPMIIDCLKSKTRLGSWKRPYPKEFENAIVVVVVKEKTTVNHVMIKIDQAIDEKRPIIIENIDLLFI